MKGNIDLTAQFDLRKPVPTSNIPADYSQLLADVPGRHLCLKTRTLLDYVYAPLERIQLNYTNATSDFSKLSCVYQGNLDVLGTHLKQATPIAVKKEESMAVKKEVPIPKIILRLGMKREINEFSFGEEAEVQLDDLQSTKPNTRLLLHKVSKTYKTKTLFSALDNSDEEIRVISNLFLISLNIKDFDSEISNPTEFTLTHAIQTTEYHAHSQTILHILKLDTLPHPKVLLHSKKYTSPLRYLIQTIYNSLPTPLTLHTFSKSAPHYFFPTSKGTIKPVLTDTQLTEWWKKTLDTLHGKRFCVGREWAGYQNGLPYKSLEMCPILEDDCVGRSVKGGCVSVEEVCLGMSVSCDFRDGAAVFCVVNDGHDKDKNIADAYEKTVNEEAFVEGEDDITPLTDLLEKLSFDPENRKESCLKVYKLLDSLDCEKMVLDLDVGEVVDKMPGASVKIINIGNLVKRKATVGVDQGNKKQR